MEVHGIGQNGKMEVMDPHWTPISKRKFLVVEVRSREETRWKFGNHQEPKAKEAQKLPVTLKWRVLQVELSETESVESIE